MAVSLESPAVSLRSRAHRWLENQRERLSLVLEGGDHWGMFRALLLAEGASGEPLNLLRLGGWVHVSSLAGIHLYGALALFEVMMAWVFGRLLGSRSGWSRGWADLLTCVLGATAWALQGFRWGFIRPFAVFLLRRFAIRAGLRWSTLGPLLLVVGLELLLSSKLEFHGMWHYGLAVAGGLIALETWPRKERHTYGFFEELKAHFVLSLGSWTPIAVVGALSTGLCAPWTFLQSLLSVTACSLVWVPVAILCLFLYSIGLEHESASILEGVQALFYWGMEVFHSVFSSSLLWTVDARGLALGLLVTLFLILLREVLRLRIRDLVLTGIVLSLGARAALFCGFSSERDEGVLQWDVRQGDAALVRIQGEVGLVDTGSARAVGISEWMMRLASERVRALDWILLTHSDEDHSGGVETLRLLLPIRQVIEGREDRLNELPFRALFLSGNRRANGEMWGVWMRFQGGGVYLNLGDADREMERRFVRELIPKEWRPEQSSVRILKVSHHGSATSTAPELLTRFRPTEAWVSSGAGNRFGHPRIEVLKRLKAFGARIMRTDQHGSLMWKSGQHSAAVDDEDVTGQP